MHVHKSLTQASYDPDNKLRREMTKRLNSNNVLTMKMMYSSQVGSTLPMTYMKH